MQTQQFTLYGAENQAPRGRSFASIDEMQAAVDAWRELPWYEAAYGTLVRRIEVGPVARQSAGSVGWYESSKAAGRVEMAKVHWNERTLCHEVAHVLAEAIHGSKSHDPYFARIYLELVFHTMGSDAFVELLHTFNDYGIDHDPKGN